MLKVKKSDFYMEALDNQVWEMLKNIAGDFITDDEELEIEITSARKVE